MISMASALIQAHPSDEIKRSCGPFLPAADAAAALLVVVYLCQMTRVAEFSFA
jgi:hypothetical protein